MQPDWSKAVLALELSLTLGQPGTMGTAAAAREWRVAGSCATEPRGEGTGEGILTCVTTIKKSPAAASVAWAKRMV